MAKAIKKQALGRGLSALLKDPDNDIKSRQNANLAGGGNDLFKFRLYSYLEKSS